MGSPEAPAFPTFRNPPLEEVALAVQFQPLAVDIVAAAEFYATLKSEFPRREEQPSRPPMAEDLSGAIEPLRIEWVTAPAMPRLWFLNESGGRLVQLQSDLLAYNWRRSGAGATEDEDYPRYKRLHADLESLLGSLTETVQADLRPNWCEVTYINHIGPLPGMTERPRLGEFLRGVEITPEGRLPHPADGAFNLRFMIPDHVAPRGRLTVTLNSAVRTTDTVPIWVLQLTARLLAEEEKLGAALTALDEGHEWVEAAFLELTSDEIQKHWGREEE